MQPFNFYQMLKNVLIFHGNHRILVQEKFAVRNEFPSTKMNRENAHFESEFEVRSLYFINGNGSLRYEMK